MSFFVFFSPFGTQRKGRGRERERAKTLPTKKKKKNSLFLSFSLPLFHSLLKKQRKTQINRVVKRAVGQNTPVLLGNKVETRYFRGPGYLEVDVDVGSSRSAAHVVGLVQGALRGLEISIAVLLEGREHDELPESLLGTVALHRIDLSRAPAFEPK